MAQQPPGGFGARGADVPPPHGLPRAPRPRSGAAVVALTVAAVLLIVMGALGVLAFVGFRQRMGHIKTAEVMNTLGQIAKLARNHYDDEERLCPSALEPVPQDAAMVSGRKYMSAPSNWHPERTDAGFGCLKFTFEYPQYYQYDYQSTGSSFTAIGRGDLNGDGVFSRRTLGGRLVGKIVEMDVTVTVEGREDD